jgi:hypothetical protein
LFQLLIEDLAKTSPKIHCKANSVVSKLPTALRPESEP